MVNYCHCWISTRLSVLEIHFESDINGELMNRTQSDTSSASWINTDNGLMDISTFWLLCFSYHLKTEQDGGKDDDGHGC